MLAADFAKFFSNNKFYEKFQNALFYSVIERNVKDLTIYTMKNILKIIIKTYYKIQKIAKKKNHIPVIVIFPQPQDINLKSSIFYKDYFKNFSTETHILDLTNYFKKETYKIFFK